jgi:transcriptional regulator with XRE-family HTH domain
MTADEIIYHLRLAWAASGLTQRQVGERMGVPQQWVSSWLRGASTPTFENACKLAAALNRPLRLEQERTASDADPS